MQSAKILDVTRSFIPIDPNAYPENLHSVEQEDSPEKRVPIIPYMGHNFLPTAHGYKSFFGTHAALNIAALAPNKPDHVFLFQNLAYKNTLIALCDTGIWMKAADSVGAWAQVIAKPAPAEEEFYEWYYTTIKNKLYCFKANDTAFYEIETNIADSLGVSCTAIVPNFITITAQLGMFRLGSRIGFWDAENAVAWCSPDDFSDFTPSVITGANVTTFNSVLGKISSIRSHGNNALIYASKSVVGLNIQAGETFFVKAIPILQSTGVPYAKQAVQAIPDNIHFVYTITGIYKITDGNPEVIVPEVFDYFKEYTTQPVYLRLLQGRYLCFEILDPDLMTGVPLFSTEIIPETNLTFPGYTSLTTNTDPDPCSMSALLNAGLTDEQKAQASADIVDSERDLTYPAQPLYTAYLSRKGVVDPEAITFGPAPCGFVSHTGTQWDMSPVGANGNTTASMGTDETNKTSAYGPDAWVDGKWTMERFVQAQTAIWELEEAQAQAVIDKIKSRAFFESTTTPGVNSCVHNPDPAYTYCALGDFVTKYSAPQFGYNGCSFWLTRYAIEAERLRTKSRTTTSCNSDSQVLQPYQFYVDGYGERFGTMAEVIAFGTSLPTATGFVFHDNPNIAGAGSPTATSTFGYITFEGTSTTRSVIANYQVTQPNRVTTQVAINFQALPTVHEVYLSGYATQIQNSSSSNETEEILAGVLAVESAFCVLTHWKYRDKNGVEKIVAASTCQNTNDATPGTPPSLTRAVPFGDPRTPLANAAGQVCGIDYEAYDDVDWPDQTITYPEASFLLQNGGIAPKYPTIYGFFCYDLHLKKWGKAKLEYKQLLDYSPINSESSSPVSFANFGILAGAVKDDGFIYIFDEAPDDSEITWGKIGFYRLGVTDVQEVRFDFTSLCSGTVHVDISLDGQQIVNSLRYSETYANARQVIAYPPYSAKWFNVTLQGKYDVSFGEVKMLRKGRR